MRKNTNLCEFQKNYFNSIAGHYSQGNKSNLDFLEKLKALVSPYIKGDVLDIGNGGIVNFNFKFTRSVTVGDIAIDLLRVLRTPDKGKLRVLNNKELKTIKIQELSALKLPFKDSTFDVVVMFNVAHHLSTSSVDNSQKNVLKSLNEINRVLKKDGIFLMLENCPTFFIKVLFDLVFGFVYFFLIKFKKPLPYFLSKSQIKNFLESNNFKVLGNVHIDWSKNVYQPILPIFSPPGWLWEMILENQLFIGKKNINSC